MKGEIIPSSLKGEISPPLSKSYLHRYLIASFLSEQEVVINIDSFSKDILATINSLKALGMNIFKVMPGKYKISRDLKEQGQGDLKIGESGSTLRFLLPLANLFVTKANFYIEPSLKDRPILPLIKALEENFLSVKKTPFGLTGEGKLNNGDFYLPGNISSQFVSGLLFTLPLLEGESRIILTSPLESVGYVKMTLKVLKDFNIEVKQKENQFLIKGNQKYKINKEIKFEADWSNSAYLLGLGALGGEISLSNLSLDSIQPDKEIINILKNFNARIKVENNLIQVKKSTLTGIEINVENIPDLTPLIATLASVSQKETFIFNASRLKLKESNRLEAITASLNNLGANVSLYNDGLKIIGKDNLIGGNASSYNDHRIAFCLSIISSACKNNVLIDNINCVEKSYPLFWEDFKKLGGKLNVL